MFNLAQVNSILAYFVKFSTLHLISDKMVSISSFVGSYIGPIISVDLKLEAKVINFIKM